MKNLKAIVFVLTCLLASSCIQQKKYISYTVKEGETIESIAEKLNLDSEDLKRLNPDAIEKLDTNTVIVIPNKAYKGKEGSKQDIDELKKVFVVHEVKKGDTFYSLTRFYNVSENELKDLNPNLKEGLKEGMVLKIKPIKEIDENVLYEDQIEKTAVSIAMLLPFKASTHKNRSAKSIFKDSDLANITADFYMGAEIAQDSLKKLGLQLNLSFFDTNKKLSKIRDIVAKNDLDEYDAIIGPLYSEEIPIVANKVSVPVVFPVFSKNQNEFKSSKIVKVQPDIDHHQEELLSYILSNYDDENILIIRDTSTVSAETSLRIQSKLEEKESIQSIKIIQPTEDGYIPKHLIINELKGGENWVILITDETVIASDVINSLISLPTRRDRKYPKIQPVPKNTTVRLFTLDKSNTFDQVDNTKLAQLEFTYTSDVFVDEESPEVKLFNQQFYKKNHTYPSYYATKGFDVVFDVAMRLASGDDLKDTFKKGTSYRIESKFNYSRKLFSTTSNYGVFVIQYTPDLILKRLK